jgi:hypothetical protein
VDPSVIAVRSTAPCRSPVLVALGEWSRKHSPAKGGPDLLHDDCDAEVRLALRCAAGHHVIEDELVVTTEP